MKETEIEINITKKERKKKRVFDWFRHRMFKKKSRHYNFF